MTLDPDAAAHAGQAIYTRRALRAYDAVIFGFNCPVIWRCRKARFMGMCSLLHCLPGTLADKAIVFEHARTVLTPDGVVFGATLLGKGVDHTRLAKRTLAATNGRGIMSHLDDSLEDLIAALARTFTTYHVSTIGSMALFSARTRLRG